MPKIFKHEEKFKQAVLTDIKQGLSVQELVKKYKVSEYYIRKWSGLIYKEMDMNHYVRYRFKWLTLQARSDIVNALADTMTDKEANLISDETWDNWEELIRKCLYEYAKEIIKAN